MAEELKEEASAQRNSETLVAVSDSQADMLRSNTEPKSNGPTLETKEEPAQKGSVDPTVEKYLRANRESGYYHQVFISHRGSKKSKVAFPIMAIFSYFCGDRFAAFDEVTLAQGDSNRDSISDALSHSKHLLVIISEDFFQSKWTVAEVEAFLNDQKHSNKEERKLIPLFMGLSPEKCRSLSKGDCRDKKGKTLSDQEISERQALGKQLGNLVGYGQANGISERDFILKQMPDLMKNKLRGGHPALLSEFDVSINSDLLAYVYDSAVSYYKKVKGKVNTENLRQFIRELKEHAPQPHVDMKYLKRGEIGRLSASLKADYCQCSHIQRLFNKDRLPISESYVNLKLAQGDGASNDFVDFKTLYESKPARYSRQRAIIIGNAGMGKTTLLKRMVYEWAEPSKGLWTGYFSQVFWIPLRQLRNLSGGNETLAGLLQLLYFNHESQSTLQSMLAQQSDTSLWLLDGYDEVLTGLTPAADKLLTQFLAQKHVLLTSRTHAVTFLREQFQVMDILGGCPEKYYELVGFKRWEVREYVAKFFSKTPEKIEGMLSFIAKPHLREMSSAPLHLEILCSLVNEQGIAYLRAKNLSSSTALYQEMLLWMMQHCAQKTPQIDRKLSRRRPQALQIQLQQQFAEHISILEKLAFNAKTELSINHQSVFDVLEIHYPGNPDKKDVVLEELLTLNILRQTGKQLNNYEFIHLSFQEFLAAKYFANQLLQADRETAQQLLVTHLPAYKHQEKFLWFLAGLLKDNPDKLHIFLETLMGENTLPGKEHIRLFDASQAQQTFLLMHCLEEISTVADFNQLPIIKEVLSKISAFSKKALSTPPTLFDPKVAQRLLTVRREVLLHLKSCPYVIATSKICESLEAHRENKHTLEEHQAVITLALDSLKLIEDAPSLLKKIKSTQSLVQLYEVLDQLREMDLSEHEKSQLSEQLEVLLSTEHIDKQILHLVFNYMDELKLWKAGQQARLIAHWAVQQNETSLYGLIKGLSLPHPQLKVSCANALARFSDNKEATEALFACLTWGDPVLAKIAVEALEKLILQGNVDAAVSLIMHVQTATESDFIRWLDVLVKANPPKHTIRSCVSVLQNISNQGSVTLEEAILAVLKEWVQKTPAIVLPTLVEGLQSLHSQSRLRCILSLKATENLGSKVASEIIEQAVEKLKDCLESAEAAVRNEAAFVLQKWAGEMNQLALPVAEKMVSSKDTAIRLQGISVLRSHDRGSQEAVSLLTSYLDDPDVTLREETTTVLKQWISHGNVHVLKIAQTILRSEDVAIRLEWVLAIGLDDRGSDAAIDILLPYLEDPDLKVRQAVASILKQWAGNGSQSFLAIAQKILASEDVTIRLEGVWAVRLGNFGSDAAVDLLSSYLKDPDVKVRQAILSILRKWAGKGIQSALAVAQKMLVSEDAVIRLEWALAVGSDYGGSDTAVNMLLPCLDDPDAKVKEVVASVLKEWVARGNQSALAAAQKMLDSKAVAVRLEWVLAIESSYSGRHKTDAAVNVLLPYLEDSDTKVREAVIGIVKRWAGNGSQPALLVAQKMLCSKAATIRLEWVLAIGSKYGGSDAAVDVLLPYLEDPDAKIREAVVSILKRWTSNSDPSALIIAQKMLRSENVTVRLQWVLVVGSNTNNWGSDAAMNVLLPCLDDPDATVRQTVTSIFRKWVGNGNPSALVIAQKMLSLGDAAVRLEWALAVGSSYRGSDAAVDVLLPCLEDPDAKARQAVARILGKWAGNGNPSVLVIAQKMLSLGDAAVRLEWVLAIGSSDGRGDTAVAMLLPYLEDSDAIVRQQAATILKKWAGWGNRFTLVVAQKMLKSEDAAARLEWVLAVGSNNWWGHGAVDFLSSCLKDSDAIIRQQAFTILKKWASNGDRSVLAVAQKILGSADVAFRLEWVSVVGSKHWWDHEAVDFLSFCLEDSDTRVRKQAAGILKKWVGGGNRFVLVVAEKMLKSADAAVRLEWVLAIGSNNSGSSAAVDLLLPCLEDLDLKVRQETTAVLKKWTSNGNQSALGLAQKMLRSADAAVRLEWLSAVGSNRWGSDEAVNLLSSCLEDSDVKVRKQAASILKKWAGNGNRLALKALEKNPIDSAEAVVHSGRDWGAPDDQISAAALHSSSASFFSSVPNYQAGAPSEEEQESKKVEKPASCCAIS